MGKIFGRPVLSALVISGGDWRAAEGSARAKNMLGKADRECPDGVQ